ncbi:hypothetical protein GGI1_13984 [Acidithiobacillus sp. GGI-221]|nr:hypothetical protein GGI1_13984 [Acidithiobacillus sp. GGI-221]
MYHVSRNILLGLAVFIFGSTLALADMGSSVGPVPQPAGTTAQPGQGTAAPMMPVQPAQGPHVGHKELHHFASAIVAIRPIDKKVRQEMSTKK